MSTDDDLRAAFAQLAGRAPDPARVQAGLAAKSRAHRQRRVLLTGGGALAVTAAAGVPAFLLSRDGPSTPEALLAEKPGRGYPMPFTPRWLPDGFSLELRVVTTQVPGPQVRRWRPKTGNNSVRLVLDLAAAPPPATASAVDINGVAGHLADEAGSVRWQPVPGITLEVLASGMADVPGTALRVARSVAVNNVEYVRPTMSFGWLPERLRLRVSFAAETGEGPGTALMAYLDGTPVLGPATIGAAIVAKPDSDYDLTAAEQTTVRGRPAWYFGLREDAAKAALVYVQLASDRWLFVVGDIQAGQVVLSRQELIRITENVWLG